MIFYVTFEIYPTASMYHYFIHSSSFFKLLSNLTTVQSVVHIDLILDSAPVHRQGFTLFPECQERGAGWHLAHT